MAMPELLTESRSRGICDRVLLVALLMSAVLHGGVLYATERWSGCVCNFGRVVCPKMGRDCQPRVNVKLVEKPEEKPPKPPPPPPPRPKPQPRPAAIVEKRAPGRPPAAPKAGKVVLPDEALAQKPALPAEIKLDRPGLREDVVVKESEVDAPVIATGEIFGRAAELTPGEPGAFGLGGTGTAVGVGPFGTEKEGSGTGMVESPGPAPVSRAPKPKGPSRPPKVLNWADPPYPDQARQQGIEGTVVLKLTVTAKGAAHQISVVRSSGHTALDETAVAHVRRAKFSPALKDGDPVPMAITFKVKFRLVNA